MPSPMPERPWQRIVQICVSRMASIISSWWTTIHVTLNLQICPIQQAPMLYASSRTFLHVLESQMNL